MILTGGIGAGYLNRRADRLTSSGHRLDGAGLRSQNGRMNWQDFLLIASGVPLVGLTSVIVLGGAAQWIAWRIRLPSILLLLVCGFVAGPVTHLVDPDQLFGNLLRPFVAISVALILFEGGLTLNFRELEGKGKIVRNLVSVGLVITGAVATVAARWLVGLDWPLALLLGAILTVTGPTVIMPMLRHIRPKGSVGTILKWEGIVIDPIGALLAVLVFEVVLSQHTGTASSKLVGIAILKTVIVGGGLGLLAAGLMIITIKRYWAPEYLQNAIALMLVVAAFAASNYVQNESGLLTVTLMGIVLANQKAADVRHIVEFKENLRVLLISALFILLSARLKFDDFRDIGVNALTFVVVMIVVARPLSILASTIRSKLSGGEKLFLMWMAPRGIVAASVASIFALDLEQKGYVEARALGPLTFTMIVASVLFYGLTAPMVAKRLGLAERDPQGVLILGAHRAGRAIARTLRELGFRVSMIDTNPQSVSAARLEGTPTHLGSVFGERVLDDLDLSGIGRIFAMTQNDPVNVLAGQRFLRIFGAAGIFQVAPKSSKQVKDELTSHLPGRVLFSPQATFASLDERVARGDVLKTTKLSETFDFAEFKKMYGDDALPLFAITEENKLRVITADKSFEPKTGLRLVALVRKPPDAPDE